MATSAKHNARRKAKFKDEPIDVAELAGMANIEGVLSFLNRKPQEYQRLFADQTSSLPRLEVPDTQADIPNDTVAAVRSATVVVDTETTVASGTQATVAPEPQDTVSTRSTATVADESTTTVVEGPSTTVAVGLTNTVAAEPAPISRRARFNTGVTAPGDVARSVSPSIKTDPTATVSAGSTDTVQARIWCTEGKEGFFPASRVRRILRAQDALTHAEESVYDVLWGPKNQTKETVRYSSFGYDTIARAARLTKMNAKHVVERLIYKGFVQIEMLPDVLRRIPTKYAVFSYRAALENMAQRSRFHVIRTGNGVLFAHPLASADTVADGPKTTVAAGQSTTVALEQQATVAVAQSDTVVAAATLSDNTSIKASRPTNVTAPPVIAREILTDFGFVDDDALRELIRKCRENAPDATDEEIAELGAMTARRIRKMTHRLDNPTGLLISQTARCFLGEPFQMYRRQNAERERKLKELYGEENTEAVKEQ